MFALDPNTEIQVDKASETTPKFHVHFYVFAGNKVEMFRKKRFV
jgi:hypothetical protein